MDVVSLLKRIEDRKRLNISFDATPYYDAPPEAINREYVQQYVEIRQQVRDIPPSPVDDHLLERLRLLGREGDRLYPTVGGLLLFSERIGEYFPYARIKCARFVGSQVGEYLDQKEITLPLPQQIEAAMKFFKANVRRGAKIQGLYREEQYEYPDVAVREALVNAVCHRDYNIGGSDIKCSRPSCFSKIGQISATLSQQTTEQGIGGESFGHIVSAAQDVQQGG